MRTLDAAFLAQLQSYELRPFSLVEMVIDGTTYRYTDCDVPISNVGAEEISDPHFNGSCGGAPWTCGSDWAIASNQASCTAGAAWLYDANQLTDAIDFLVRFTLVSVSAGSIRPLAGNGAAGTFRSAAGTYSEVLTCSGGLAAIFDPDATFAGTIEEPSFKQIFWSDSLEVYAPLGLSIAPVSFSTETVVDQATIEIDTVDEVLIEAFVGGTPQGSTVTLKNVALDSSFVPVGAATWFEGTIDSWQLDEGKLDFTVTNDLTRWQQRTLSLHPASCRWKVFKGTECTYSGGMTWCDRTYARCLALNNTANFGGFRWLPSIIDKELWWGRDRNLPVIS